ncbi:MAG TPA: hypothetical protein VGM19_09775 [Armatimonadota bacterium]|jgi:hypothetical protein
MRIRYVSAVTLLLTLAALGGPVSAAPVPAPAPAPLAGENLMPNGSAEEVNAQGQPTGWELANPAAATLTTALGGCAGERCLQVERKADAPADANASLTSPVAPTEAGWYLLSFWFKYDFPPESKPLPLVYVQRRAGADRTGWSGSPMYFYFANNPPSGEWHYAFLVLRQRADQTGLQMRMDSQHMGRQLSLDSVQVRRLNLPATFTLLSTNVIRTSYWGGEWVPDSDAMGGIAWRVTEGLFPPGSKMSGPVRTSELPGLYRATYRLKRQVPGGQPVGLNLSGGGGQTMETILPEDFAENGKYQEFTAYFLYPFGGGTGCNWDWGGKGTYDFDMLKLELIRRVSDHEAWNLLYQGVDADRVLPAPPAAPVVAGAPPRAWLGFGLYTEESGLPKALTAAGFQTNTSAISGDGKLVPTFPGTVGLRLMVLADVPARMLSPVEKFQIMRWVSNGGGLVVSGGPYGFGYGGTPGSFVGDLLPVTEDWAFDLYRLPQPAPVLRPNGEKLGMALWLHRAKPRDKAKVLLTAGGQPFAVGWQYGQGKVLALLGPPLGEPPSPYWENPAWTNQLANLLKWTAGL